MTTITNLKLQKEYFGTIRYQNKPYEEKEILEALHPIVREWWLTKYKSFSPPQFFSILNIHRKINTLISSPTGSGKTLSAFLAILNKLVTLAAEEKLENRVYCIYISPLKALANDINKNLKEPLKEIKELAKKKYKLTLNIRVGIRTGDTTPSQKQGMLKNPPHILITTPESLAISITTVKFGERLKETDYVVVDEIHSLAENKRGVHLSLSLERLNYNTNFTRIGLSATVSPLEEVARFLVGTKRNCRIIDVQAIKKMDFKVLCPVDNIMKASHAQTQSALYEMLHELIQKHKTTLVFTNTRAGTERVVHFLKERFPKFYTGILDAETKKEQLELETELDLLKKNNGSFQADFKIEEKEIQNLENKKSEEQSINNKITKDSGNIGYNYTKSGYIGAHHGSLSKRHRTDIEDRLKRGELKAVVCSTSLELGIDIGSIDLVVLLGSPKSVARALQRIGRSGHKLNETAKGRIIVLDRDDMVECSILLKSAIEHKIDKIHIPKNALDVLAQQIYGIAIDEIKHIDTIYGLIKNSYCYHSLTYQDFMQVINYLAGEYVSLEERSVYAKIWFDRETGNIGKKGKLARLIYMTNVGTIPDETNIKVKIGDRLIGTITEDFLERLKPGDVFVLGGEAYIFKFARGQTAQVQTSLGKPPTVPNWISEMLPLSFDLALEIQKFRKYVEGMFLTKRTKKDIKEYINSYLYADKSTINSIYEYFREQYNFAKIPHKNKIVIENFKDGNIRYTIIHSLYGRRVNDVLSRAIAYIIGKINKRDVEINISDNGFYLRSKVPINAKKALSLIKSEDIYKIMNFALEKSEVLKRRFRHCAGRALMILRKYKGKTKSVGRQQISSQILINTLKRIDENFPILKEARREVLEDLMDIQNAAYILKELELGKIKVEEISTSVPSPFAFNLIMSGYSDILKMEEKKDFIIRMHKLVLQEIEKKEKKEEEKEEKEKRLANTKNKNQEKIKFNYEQLWREIEEQRLEEKDSTRTELIRQTWNLPRVPVFVKEEIVKLLEGKKQIRDDVEELIKKYKPEIEKTWPVELVEIVFKKLEIPFDENLKKNEKKYFQRLRNDWLKATRKNKINDELRKEGLKLIDQNIMSNELKEFLEVLLKGTISNEWTDELILFLKEKNKELMKN